MHKFALMAAGVSSQTQEPLLLTQGNTVCDGGQENIFWSDFNNISKEECENECIKWTQ